jgi:hypothetical protein
MECCNQCFTDMALAGYSGTPLIKKLGLKVGLKLRLVNAPAVDVKVCAVSEEWSGLKLVVPAKNR